MSWRWDLHGKHTAILLDWVYIRSLQTLLFARRWCHNSRKRGRVFNRKVEIQLLTPLYKFFFFLIYLCSIQPQDYFSFEFFLNSSGLGSQLACCFVFCRGNNSREKLIPVHNPEFGFLGLVCSLPQFTSVKVEVLNFFILINILKLQIDNLNTDMLYELLVKGQVFCIDTQRSIFDCRTNLKTQEKIKLIWASQDHSRISSSVNLAMLQASILHQIRTAHMN